MAIIEVPQWLARLEPQLAALDRGEQIQMTSPIETSSPQNAPQPASLPERDIQPPHERPPEQRELF